MIFMKAKFDKLTNAAALTYLDLPDVNGNVNKACIALAKDRWEQINDEKLKTSYMERTEDDIFEAYLLYQADENFYKIFLTGPLADVPKDQAREFQDLVVEKFGSDFWHDKVQCTNWWFAKENKEAPFEVEDHKPAHVLTEDSQTFVRNFMAMTGADTKVVWEYSAGWSHDVSKINDAVDQYHRDMATAGVKPQGDIKTALRDKTVGQVPDSNDDAQLVEKKMATVDLKGG